MIQHAHVLPFDMVVRKTKRYDIQAIEKAREIIEKNITDHWSMGLLAAKAGINEFKLKRGFRELYNTSPYQYLIGLRLKRAMTFLEETDLTIREIADRVGFDTYKGFSKAFKKWYGIAATAYRRDKGERYYQRVLHTQQVDQH